MPYIIAKAIAILLIIAELFVMLLFCGGVYLLIKKIGLDYWKLT